MAIEMPSFLIDAAKVGNIDDINGMEMARYLDSIDPLAHLRNEFHYPKMKTLPHVDHRLVNDDDDSIYLCGNSLGLMPKRVEYYMKEQMDKWANMGVFGHFEQPLPWAHCDECVLEGMEKLVGAETGEVAMMNGLTVNVHILMTAFYRPTKERHKILIESRSFPSDHYAIQSQIRLHHLTVEESMLCLEPRPGEDCLRLDDILAYITEHGQSIAIIFFSGVQYYTGQFFDMKTITAAGQKMGCLVGWNLAHAFINVPLALHDWNVDFACWCTYKYGNTCAGGMAGAFVHSRHDTEPRRERMLGWWSHRMSTRFRMDNELDLDEGAAGYRISNPPIFLVVPLKAMLDVMNKTSMADLRAKSKKLTGYLEYLIEHFLGPTSPFNEQLKNDISCVSIKDISCVSITPKDSSQRGCHGISCVSITPKDPSQRGCQLSLKFNIDIDNIYKELVKRGVACDERHPNVIRVAPVHLYNSFVDVRRFISALLDSLRTVNKEK